jgi:hypothetical protein
MSFETPVHGSKHSGKAVAEMGLTNKNKSYRGGGGGSVVPLFGMTITSKTQFIILIRTIFQLSAPT